MSRWFVRIVLGIFALVGVGVIAAAAVLWVLARPILEQARTNYAAISAGLRCEGEQSLYPPGYPRARRAVQIDHDIELSVYRDACADTGLGSHCAYMSGGFRKLGFSVYHRAYLSQCEMRALNLHGDTSLNTALDALYPGRDPGGMSEVELTCVALAARAGVRTVCRLDATCCADSGVAQTPEMPR